MNNIRKILVGCGLALVCNLPLIVNGSDAKESDSDKVVSYSYDIKDVENTVYNLLVRVFAITDRFMKIEDEVVGNPDHSLRKLIHVTEEEIKENIKLIDNVTSCHHSNSLLDVNPHSRCINELAGILKKLLVDVDFHVMSGLKMKIESADNSMLTLFKSHSDRIFREVMSYYPQGLGCSSIEVERYYIIYKFPDVFNKLRDAGVYYDSIGYIQLNEYVPPCDY